MNQFQQNPLLIVDIAPLFELQYTGISNVVNEIAKRLLVEDIIDIKYQAMGREIPINIIEKCVSDNNGEALQKAFSAGNLNPLSPIDNGKLYDRSTIGLFTNTKPPKKVFSVDTQIYYDFSTLLVPECHTEDTVRHHLEGITDQISSCDLLFCISESTAKDLEWIFGVHKDKIRVSLLGNNVNLRFSRAAKTALRGSNIEPFFLILGTIEPRKNVSVILKWLKQNPQVAEEYRFVFAGREGWGPSFQEIVLSEDVKSLFDRGRIVNLGYIDEWLKATLLSGAEALIFPSFFEGFGLPVLEAMAVGTLVISSCSTSLPEVLGDSGYYFNPESPVSLHRAFLQLKADLAVGYGSNIRARALEQASTFSYDNTYDVILKGLLEKAQELT